MELFKVRRRAKANIEASENVNALVKRKGLTFFQLPNLQQHLLE